MPRVALGGLLPDDPDIEENTKKNTHQSSSDATNDSIMNNSLIGSLGIKLKRRTGLPILPNHLQTFEEFCDKRLSPFVRGCKFSSGPIAEIGLIITEGFKAMHDIIYEAYSCKNKNALDEVLGKYDMSKFRSAIKKQEDVVNLVEDDDDALDSFFAEVLVCFSSIFEWVNQTDASAYLNGCTEKVKSVLENQGKLSKRQQSDYFREVRAFGYGIEVFMEALSAYVLAAHKQALSAGGESEVIYDAEKTSWYIECTSEIEHEDVGRMTIQEANHERLVRKIRYDFTSMVSAIVSTRVVLFQIIPALTPLTIFASAMSTSPVLLGHSSDYFKKTAPPMILNNPFSEARKEEQDRIDEAKVFFRSNWGGDEEDIELESEQLTINKWMVNLNAVFLFIFESRLCRFITNLTVFAVSMALTYGSPEFARTFVIVGSIIFFIVSAAVGLYAIVLLGNAMDIDDNDLTFGLGRRQEEEDESRTMEMKNMTGVNPMIDGETYHLKSDGIWKYRGESDKDGTISGYGRLKYVK